jgi:hypothetical protein
MIPTLRSSLRRYEQRLERREKQQLVALGRLGWALRRIEHETDPAVIGTISSQRASPRWLQSDG